MIDVYVHPHALKHGIPEEEVLHAWTNYVRSQQRACPDEDQCVRVGYGKTIASPIQMVGIVQGSAVLIIHAMTPPQTKVLRELGMVGERRTR